MQDWILCLLQAVQHVSKWNLFIPSQSLSEEANNNTKI